MSCCQIRNLSDPIFYTNFLFIILGIYVLHYEDYLYFSLSVLNFAVSGYYHYHYENRLRLLDNILSKISVGIFVYDTFLCYTKNNFLTIFNILSNLIPLIYSFYMSRKYRIHVYEYLHVGVHYFASMYGFGNHYIKYHL